MEFDQIIENSLKKLPEDKLREVEDSIPEMKVEFEKMQKHCEESLTCPKCSSAITIHGDQATCTKCRHKFKWLVQDIRGLKI